MVAAAHDLASVWATLEGVLDPEVPVLSVVELGIVRDVALDADGHVTVSITPTYSGCPALQVIERDILDALARDGWPDARLRTVYSPAWTTELIGAEARRKLEAYGIASPPAHGSREAGTRDAGTDELVPLRRRVAPVACPYCGSHATTTRSDFGSTACKALMYCEHCRQPFELFKAI
jgi:ring-1,2-phenylacetyl-CoA epoxidase subunit PaaD